MPYSPELAEAMRRAVRRRRGITEKKMFGGYCWLLHDRMFAGVEVKRFMFRVGPAQYDAALRRPGARPMDITGKPMRGFVWVSSNDCGDQQLDEWIDLATRYVRRLPPKSPKTAPSVIRRSHLKTSAGGTRHRRKRKSKI